MKYLHAAVCNLLPIAPILLIGGFAPNVYSAPAGQNNCTVIGQRCLEPGGTKQILGASVTRSCWKTEKVYECDRPNPINSCAIMYNRQGYSEIASKCVDSKYGKCVEFQKQYEVKIPPGTELTNSERLNAGVTYLTSKHKIKEVVDSTCGSLSGKPGCSLIQSKTCVEPASTRTINGVNITRSCWKWETTYKCKGPTKNDCTNLEKRSDCKLVKTNVFSRDSKGTPTFTEKVYSCISSRARYAPDREVCTGGQVTLPSGDKVDKKRPINKDFARAVTFANVLQRAKKDKDIDDGKINSIFGGQSKGCDKSLGGLSNCCTDDGFLQQISLTTCNAEEVDLAKRQAKGYAHYVGSYCSSRILGFCLKKTKTYCVFKSKLARIIHQQGRTQIKDFTFGSASSPNCRGFTIAELQSLDFSKIDLSEFFDDANAKIGGAKGKHNQDDMKKKISDYYKNKKKPLPKNGGSN